MMGSPARFLACMLSAALVMPVQGWAQITPAPVPQPAAPAPDANADDAAQSFSTEQLDALLAPIALYPDALLTQVLMAATQPLEIVQASRWLEDPQRKALAGDALTNALVAENWDPSVKSLVPFPQVLDMMNTHLDWTQQLGYAFATQQADVLDSVQRLRRQAQVAGTLTTTEQQVVTVQNPGPSPTIIIEPAQPNVVFVPQYNPAVAFGTWPYASVPPVYFPPPPGYAFGNALLTGLAFGTGVAITAGLWNLARPNWGWRGPGGYGGVNVNVNNWNRVNVNRTQINNGNWRPPARPGGGYRPVGGPVGRPNGGRGGIPPGAIGRPNVSVPGDLVNRPGNRPGGGAGNRPNIPGGGAGGGNRPSIPGGGAGGGNRPNIPGGGAGGANRPNIPSAGNRPQTPGGGANRPGGGQGINRPGGGGAAARPSAPARQPPAFSNMNQGNREAGFGQRGGQSRQQMQRPAGGGGGGARAGGAPRGGGGGGGGARGGGGGRHR